MITREELIVEWIKALRSGKYRQGRDVLNHNENYCCLGVLCEVAIENGIVLEKTVDSHGKTLYDGRATDIPNKLRDILGVGRNIQIGMNTAMGMNDSLKYTFLQIADEIEKHGIAPVPDIYTDSCTSGE